MLENFLHVMPDFMSDAVLDSVKLLPSLFLIFVFIEIFENFFAHKIAAIVSFSKKFGPVAGAFLAIIPQCGFSVIMTTLFIKKYITLGTLIAVYIATSDEAIPILLSTPDSFYTVAKIIIIKLFIAILVGYAIDFIVKPHLHRCEENAVPCTHLKTFEPERGCCSHEISENKILNVVLHPIKHTLIIFAFILLSCCALNYAFELYGDFLT